jgi:hypothetical protein
MSTLAPKLILTPLLVGSASLAGRRWGAALSGWLVAMPLTSGPIALFIALDAGAGVARDAAHGSLLGAVAQVAFAAVYTAASRRLGWIRSLTTASVAFFVVGFATPSLAPVVTYLLLLAAVGLFLWISRQRHARAGAVTSLPAWDIAARVVVATALVVAISSLAPFVGGHVSGVLATFPVYASVLATFGHLTRGPGEAAEVLRGLVTGLIGFGAFFLGLGALLAVTGIAVSFLGAFVIGLAVQAATLPLLRLAAHDQLHGGT